MPVQNDTVLLSVFIAWVTVLISELTSAINVAADLAASASQEVFTVDTADTELVTAKTRRPDSITVSVNSKTRSASLLSRSLSPSSGMRSEEHTSELQSH